MYNKAFITTGDSVMKLPFFTSSQGYSDGQPVNKVGRLIIAFHLLVFIGGAILIWSQIKPSPPPLFTVDKLFFFIVGVILVLNGFFKLGKLGGLWGGIILGYFFGFFLYGVLYSVFGNYMVQELNLPIMALPIAPSTTLMTAALLLAVMSVPSRFEPFQKKL